MTQEVAGYYKNDIRSKKLKYNGLQRAGLYAGWELVFRLPITAAD